MSNDPTQIERRLLLKNTLATIERLQAKLDAFEKSRQEPLAIIGMSCRFPGGANSPEAYWSLLQNGLDTIREVPSDRWPNNRSTDSEITWYGSFLDDIDQFDPQFFGISPREAATMDPQQRLVLEVTWEALERGGIAPDSLRSSQTGVFVGITTNDYAHLNMMRDPAELDAYAATGSALNVVPGRVAYTLGLHGPSIAIDTACSSSLVAIHLACQSLRLRESDMALAGGVNVLLRPEPFICFSRWGMMAPDGRCKAFDARADGFVRGEGCGMIVLKRLSDALANGDAILALIRGSAVNQDGRSSGLTVPNGLSQRAVIQHALLNAGVKPAEIGYVEAHGTGTPLGDPIEVGAIGEALHSGRKQGAQPLFLSSVKANIGHLESASGVAGLMKVVLALHHKEIPAQLHLKERNSKIPWPAFEVEIPTATTAWTSSSGKYLAGVSSFGFSGTNAHIVLAEAPDAEETIAQQVRSFHLLTLSAPNETALTQVTAKFADHLSSYSDLSPGDVTFTANTGRAHFAYRLAVVGARTSTLGESLAAFAAGHETPSLVSGAVEDIQPQLAFLFTGQGAQYLNMGRQLFETEPVFREAMERCDETLRPLLDRSLLSVIHPAAGNASEAAFIDQTEYTQPALFAIEYALAQLWQSWGVVPAAVMGHSVGEYVAACIAGVISLEDGLKLIAARGRLMGNLPAGGAMAAVFADEMQVQSAIADYSQQVSLAAVNGPRNVVISGDGTVVTKILEQLAAQGIAASRLTVSHAFHSPLMEPILEALAGVAGSVRFAEPKIEFISNVSGATAGPEILTAAYWRDHVRKPVRFADGLKTLAERGCMVFLECGPQPTLSAMGQRCLPEGTAAWLPSLRPGSSDVEQMLKSLGELYTRGVRVDWQSFHGVDHRRVVLPTYPFQRRRYWIEPPKRRHPGAGAALHPLIQERLSSPLIRETVFSSYFATGAPAYLNDHRVFNLPLFPGTGFLELVLASARLAFGTDEVALTHVEILEALVLPEEGERLVYVAVSPLQDGQATVRVFSQNDNESWKQHATAMVQASAPPADAGEPPGSVKGRCAEKVEISAYYQRLADIGVVYGPGFRGIQTIRRRDGEALADVKLPEGVSARGYFLHPALLDACFQVLGATLPESRDSASASVYVPVAVSHFQIFHPVAAGVQCHAVLDTGVSEAEVLRGSLRLLDGDGQLLALVKGIELKRFSRTALQQAAQPSSTDLLYQVNWQLLPTASSAADRLTGHWLILAGEDKMGAALAGRLQQQGATTTIVSPSVLDVGDPRAYTALVERAAENNALCGVIHLWGLLEGETTQQTLQLGYGSALFLTQALLARRAAALPRLWLATQGAQAAPGDGGKAVRPAQTALWGFARTLSLEHPEYRPVIVDLDPTAAEPESDLIAELTGNDGEDQIAWRGGLRYGARLTRWRADPSALDIPNDRPYEIFTPKHGILDNLSVRAKTPQPPGRGEVAIAIHATGLNFRDVLNVLGMYTGPAGALGNECAGLVTAVGTEVTHVRVGDAVVALAEGTFASTVTTRAEFVHPIPAGLSLVEAATLPIVFLTVYYGLHHLAHIQPGDRVLIHAATGGVGMAAVQLAQRVGAEIFATAGSPEKRALLRSLGVAHVMNSRTLDFADEIMASTEGKGVNIVLNALADDFICKSFSVLADNGRFLEIGKRGIWTQEQAAAFNPTLSYYPYDLADVAREKPQLIGEMWQRLKPQFESGELRPLPLQTFNVSEVIDAFRFMSQARHVGKVVVVPPTACSMMRADASYLITGGMGGLGLALAQGLVERGARHLVLVGRNAPSETARVSLQMMRADGAKIVVAQADVSEALDVQRILAQIAAEMPPLRGVVHAAGTLADGHLLNQSWEKFETVMRPKILGSENLDKFTRKLPLDFFVCFSAGAVLLGSPGQVNYSAANAFMDGLAHARRTEGLPAMSINWGAWADVGMAAAVDNRTKTHWQAAGIGLIPPRDGIEIFLQLLAKSPVQVGVLAVNWRRMAQEAGAGKERPFLSELLSVQQTGLSTSQTADRESLLVRLERVPTNDRFDVLKTFVRNEVMRVLRLDQEQVPDSRQGFTEIGMDSLMAIELRNRLQAGVEQRLPTTLAFEYPTIDSLADYLAGKLRVVENSVSRTTDTKSVIERQPLASEIETFSEDELKDSLLKELEAAGY